MLSHIIEYQKTKNIIIQKEEQIDNLENESTKKASFAFHTFMLSIFK